MGKSKTENAIFVDPLGSKDCRLVPPAFLDGSTTGTDDWSCDPNDEFIFQCRWIHISTNK
ncbi:MAG: hypothetical protein IPP15_23390 [Saprospiraceae bacterium]|uniref:Uncharacterized protein n=1 Tax=Candidatus Opimibacter skivensis TaxID=2982028 RepID=A0A9D7SZV8_9BACT|nr:hypothetical protein [Candidatus Opimibacter skivensis]